MHFQYRGCGNDVSGGSTLGHRDRWGYRRPAGVIVRLMRGFIHYRPLLALLCIAVLLVAIALPSQSSLFAAEIPVLFLFAVSVAGIRLYGQGEARAAERQGYFPPTASRPPPLEL